MDPIDLDHGHGIWKFFLDLSKKECYLFIYLFILIKMNIPSDILEDIYLKIQ